jgi:hypothetical protein
MTCFLCGPFQGCCLETIEGTLISMQSVLATIGKLFILYRPMVNSVAMQCNNRAAVFSLWSDHKLYKACYRVIIKTHPAVLGLKHADKHDQPYMHSYCTKNAG